MKRYCETMRVCPTIQAIAEAIIATRQELSPEQKARVEMLRLMPHYAEAKDLGTWEWTYKESSPLGTDAELDGLIDAVFGFGEHNLYCAFDPTGTNRLYYNLSSQLRRMGIAYPEHGEFTDL